jgi:ABC-2 type transport system ATP-binding protein
VEAQRLCNRVAVMQHGNLVALGTPSELTRQYVRRLDVALEVDPLQMDLAVETLQKVPQLTTSAPKRENDVLTLTLSGRDSIPELLSLLVQHKVRVYRLAPQEANLEEVYFALNGDAS